MKNILIYGASGHSKMIVDIIHKTSQYNIIGFLDSYKPHSKNIYGYEIIGNLDHLTNLIKQYRIEGMVIGIGDSDTRLRAYKKIINLEPNIEFVPIVHPNAILAEGFVIPEGTVVMAGAIINADAKVGKFCLLNTKSSLGHDSVMSDFSSLASGATISGNVSIGFCSTVSLNAAVSQNQSIGNYTIIGGGSLVLKSIGDYKLAYGVPINIIKTRQLD